MRVKICLKHSKIDTGSGWRTVDSVIARLAVMDGVAYITECPKCWRERRREEAYRRNYDTNMCSL